LDNISIGGSIRFRDEPFIGAEARYVEITLSDGSSFIVTSEDPEKPLFGEAFWFFDAMVGYKGKLRLDGKDMEYSLQVNVRNLFNESGAYTTNANAVGQPVRMAQNIPREIFLSAKLMF
jgi:outer membrane receptor for monomeric catechols